MKPSCFRDFVVIIIGYGAIFKADPHFLICSVWHFPCLRTLKTMTALFFIYHEGSRTRRNTKKSFSNQYLFVKPSCIRDFVVITFGYGAIFKVDSQFVICSVWHFSCLSTLKTMTALSFIYHEGSGTRRSTK